MKRNKLIKSLSLGIISLGLLAGLGMSTNNDAYADYLPNVPGGIDEQDLKQSIAETKAGDAQTEAAEIESGIQMCRKYPQIAASDAADDNDHIFQQHKNQILPYYNKAQMKEFINDFASDADEGYTIDSKGDVHPPKTTHHSKKINKHNHKRIKRSKAKRITHKKRAVRKHRAKRVRKPSYNYLGSSKQGKSQARRDYHNHKFLNESDKKEFNHLIKNKKFKSSKYLNGYVNKFIDMANVDENSDFADSYTHLVGYVQDYLRGNSTTRRAISDYYNHNKPNKRLVKHNHQYKEVYDNITIA